MHGLIYSNCQPFNGRFHQCTTCRQLRPIRQYQKPLGDSYCWGLIAQTILLFGMRCSYALLYKILLLSDLFSFLHGNHLQRRKSVKIMLMVGGKTNRQLDCWFFHQPSTFTSLKMVSMHENETSHNNNILYNNPYEHLIPNTYLCIVRTSRFKPCREFLGNTENL